MQCWIFLERMPSNDLAKADLDDQENAMKTIIEQLKGLVRNEEAVTAIEYALLAALIAVAIIAGASMLGKDIGNVFSSVGSAL